MLKDEDIASLDTVVDAPTLPEAEVNIEAPPDKEPQARDDAGKFASDKKPEAKEETKEPAKEPAKAEPRKEPQTVPLAAHLEEKRAIKAELDALKAELAALKNPPKQPTPPPEFQEDPRGYVDHQTKSVLEQLEQTRRAVEETKQQANLSVEQTQQIEFRQHLQAAEMAFAQEHPDYMDALGHLRAIRSKQLQIFDPNLTQEQINRQIGLEEFNMAMGFARNNRNPVQMAYQLAEAYGYVPKAKQEPAPEVPKVAGPKTLPPEQTLGSGAGGGAVEDDKVEDPFDQAFNEMFKRKRA